MGYIRIYKNKHLNNVQKITFNIEKNGGPIIDQINILFTWIKRKAII